MSYVCSFLNRQTHLEFGNPQYQDLKKDEKGRLDYDIRSECTVFFEVDGPYKAMIIPKAIEEDRQLKKRYVVFWDSGKVAELKGFEIKRRGELKLIKDFQQQVKTVFATFTLIARPFRPICADKVWKSAMPRWELSPIIFWIFSIQRGICWKMKSCLK